MLVFSFFYLFSSVLLYLPVYFPRFIFIEGHYNWSGKIYSLLGSVAFLFVFRKYTLEDYYLTLKQKRGTISSSLLVIGGLLIVEVVINIIYHFHKEFDLETILYQATMPGLDEEIVFRGILLGLLYKLLISPSKIIFHPAIWVTSVLFGFGHSLSLNQFAISFNLEKFLLTFPFALAMGWITLKSRSLLFPILSHNLNNVAIQIMSMMRI